MTAADVNSWPTHGYAHVLVRAQPSLIARLDRVLARPELQGVSRNRLVLRALQAYVERIEAGGEL